MKPPDIKNWVIDPNPTKKGIWFLDGTPAEGMLLFAQLCIEKLNERTHESFKVRTFNLLALCEELIDAYGQFEAGVLHARSITPIVQELQHQLSLDSVAKQLMPSRLPVLSESFSRWDQSKPSKGVSHSASSIFSELVPKIVPSLIESLKSLIRDPSKKKEIQKLTGELLTELIRRGYSRNYIFAEVTRTFFGDETITSVTFTDDFLDRFLGPIKSYQVMCRAPHRGRLLVTHLQEHVVSYSPSIQKRLLVSEAETKFFEVEAKRKGFLVFASIQAFDPVAARQQAVGLLNTISSVVQYLVHRIDITEALREEWLVYEGEDSESAYILGPPENVSFQRPDVPVKRFEKSLADVLGPIISADVDPRTREKLLSSLNAHSSGVQSSIEENQFVNFWRAFETLVGSSTERETIQSILSASLPVLSRTYFRRLVSTLWRDIRTCNPSFWQDLEGHRKEGEGNVELTARFVSTDEMAELRKGFYVQCDDNPLLRNRVFFVRGFLTSVREARELLAAHEDRVRWHIQRMYRVRNSIIHASKASTRLNLLTENLHAYFDRVFLEVSNNVLRSSHHMTSEMVFYESNLKYESYKRVLSADTEGLGQIDLARLIVFGKI